VGCRSSGQPIADKAFAGALSDEGEFPLFLAAWPPSQPTAAWRHRAGISLGRRRFTTYGATLCNPTVRSSLTPARGAAPDPPPAAKAGPATPAAALPDRHAEPGHPGATGGKRGEGPGTALPVAVDVKLERRDVDDVALDVAPPGPQLAELRGTREERR